MTTNIFSALSSAKLGLLAQQLAIEVTGQNIANVETEGYSRQDVTFEANTPRHAIKYGSMHQIGTGVRVAGIERAHDQFLFEQIMDEGDLTGSTEVKKDIFEQLEILFNEGSGRSLNDALSSFFASVHDLATNARGLPERADLVSKAENLASTFNQTGKQLYTIQRNIDATIETEVTEINSLTTQIGKLNENIHANEPGSQYKANKVVGATFDMEPGYDRATYASSKFDDFEISPEGVKIISSVDTDLSGGDFSTSGGIDPANAEMASGYRPCAFHHVFRAHPDDHLVYYQVVGIQCFSDSHPARDDDPPVPEPGLDPPDPE